MSEDDPVMIHDRCPGFPVRPSVSIASSGGIVGYGAGSEGGSDSCSTPVVESASAFAAFCTWHGLEVYNSGTPLFQPWTTVSIPLLPSSS